MRSLFVAIALVAFCAPGCKSHRAEPRSDSTPPGPASAAPAATPATFVNVATGGSACQPACTSIERCDQGRCVPNCPEGEVFIPATGPKGFDMGHGARFAFDQKHRVVLSKQFCMDATEVTVESYRKCVESTKCTIPQLLDQNSNYRPEFHRDQHPVNMVNWMQAKNYCEIQDQALPTEAQWEWAASHGDGRRYPWGRSPEPTCENGTADFTPGGAPKSDPAGDVGCHGGGSSKVKSHPAGNSKWPNGDLYDLGGNLWEWTADCYIAYPDEAAVDPSPQNNPKLGGDCYVRSLRGGGWNRSKQALVTWWRAGSKRTYRVPGLGFRCVRNPS
jgi:formylglycine-generating enzyme required for sulfatase activity